MSMLFRQSVRERGSVECSGLAALVALTAVGCLMTGFVYLIGWVLRDAGMM